MSKVSSSQEINLELPIEKEFASLLRLVVSAIASRMNFDIDAIDDLKIACEEAYLMAIGCCLGSCQAITFLGREDSLEITFKKLIKSAAKDQDKLKKQQDYCLFIIKAVVDKVEKLSSSPDYYDLKLTKYLKNTSRG